MSENNKWAWMGYRQPDWDKISMELDERCGDVCKVCADMIERGLSGHHGLGRDENGNLALLGSGSRIDCFAEMPKEDGKTTEERLGSMKVVEYVADFNKNISDCMDTFGSQERVLLSVGAYDRALWEDITEAANEVSAAYGIPEADWQGGKPTWTNDDLTEGFHEALKGLAEDSPDGKIRIQYFGKLHDFVKAARYEGMSVTADEAMKELQAKEDYDPSKATPLCFEIDPANRTYRPCFDNAENVIMREQLDASDVVRAFVDDYLGTEKEEEGEREL